MTSFTESVVEEAALAWLEGLGYSVLHGPDIAAGEPGAERSDPNYRDVVLDGRLRQSLVRLNPDLPPEALEDAHRKLLREDGPSLVERNRALHRMLVDGVTVEYRRKDGSIGGAQAHVIDFDTPDNNDWLAVNQFSVSEGQHTRRPDVVLFVNGLPLAVIELKNTADENATMWSAFHQLQTYQAQIPALFTSNAALVASDGVQTRIGSLGAGKEWFKPWRTIAGREDASARLSELQVVLEGVFEKRRFLDLLRYFIVFEDSGVDGGGGTIIKKIAGYHQFHAVNVAVEETLRAAKVVAQPLGRYAAGHQPGGDDEQGALKVVMTGSASDPLEWQPHIRNKKRREDLALRFRAPKDPFQIVIVRDMWLTGFDAPSLHTMYVDKPMHGHGLMQAIARVNRVFKDKPGGLVVDYLGLADELKQALATYTEAGGTGKTALDQAEAVALMLEKHEICRALFHGFDWSPWTAGTPQARLSLLPAAQEHILAQKDGKDRLLRAVTELSQAFALAVPHEESLRIRDVGFFQAVRSVLAKNLAGERKTDEDLDHAIRQIISKAMVSDEVVDIFAAAGLKKPDISILSDEFLSEVRDMPQRNLAVELLQKLLKGEIRMRSKRNVVQARSFAEMLEQSLRKYQNRAIETAKVIEELIQLAKDMRAASARGEQLGLSDDEVAFYDALETNDSAVKVMGDEALRIIARELVKTVRANVTIDWTMRDNVRAQLRVLVKRILRKYGYPPDLQERATQTVLEQAEVLSQEWVTT